VSTGKITGYGLLRFEGADAQNFLQGQLTSDVKALAAGQHQYTGYCTAKGRLLCTGLLWREGAGKGESEAWLLMLPQELAEPMRKRLSMYILRAKVKASDASTALTLYGGRGAAPAIAGATVLALQPDRYLLAAPAGTAVETTGTVDWAALDIAAGIPMITAATQEQFVPQTVNLDCIGAVSFSKGCYPGQEIVARSHYLGKIKQRMVRGTIATTTAATAAAGDKLYAEEFGGQASGMIVNAVAADDGGSDVLAVVHTTSAAQGGIHWQSPDGALLAVGSLPYAVS
jgi:hypothetical protein